MRERAQQGEHGERGPGVREGLVRGGTQEAQWDGATRMGATFNVIWLTLGHWRTSLQLQRLDAYRLQARLGHEAREGPDRRGKQAARGHEEGHVRPGEGDEGRS